MRQLGEINEGTSAVLSVTFLDEDGALVTPSGGTYRVDAGNGTAVRGITAFTPSGSTHALILDAADNTITDTELVTEPHIVTLTWVFGGSRTGTEECSYNVKNLLFL